MFWTSRSNFSANHFFLILILVGLTLMNGSEIALLLLVKIALNPIIPLKLYYAGAIVSITALTIYSAPITRSKLGLWALTQIAIAAALGTWLLVSSDIIAGASYLSYSITRIPGTHYWAFQSYALLTLPAALIRLAWLARTTKDKRQKKRYQLIGLGVFPTVLSALIVIVLMHLGIAVNATVWLSAASSILLITITWSEAKHGTFRFLSRELFNPIYVVPRTKERILKRRITQEISEFTSKLSAGEAASLKASIRNIEHHLTNHALSLTNQDLQKAASQIKISVSSLRRKIKLPSNPNQTPPVDSSPAREG